MKVRLTDRERERERERDDSWWPPIEQDSANGSHVSTQSPIACCRREWTLILSTHQMSLATAAVVGNAPKARAMRVG
jgi:hypothetical protein